MIPAIALMIGCYIITRSMEIILRKPPEGSTSTVSQAILVLLALGTVLVTAAMTWWINVLAPTSSLGR